MRSLLVRATRVVLRLAALLAAVILVLATWNLAVTRRMHTLHPVPGSFYAVEGRQMHLYCLGAGSPVIVVEAGLGSDWLGWQTVQPSLSTLTRVCTYDRAGLGWSEPRSRPRDAETIARQLHALLDIAGVQPPLILAGHSAGGLYIREYAREFPSNVVGMVLVDAASPQQLDEEPGFRAAYEEDKRNAWRELFMDRLRVWSGYERLVGHCHETPGKGLESWIDQYEAQACRPAYVDGDLGEYLDLEIASKQAGRLTSLGTVPLLILTKDPNRRGGNEPMERAKRQVWEREQEALKSLSSLSWRVIARGAGHKIFQDRPELVFAEVSRLVEYLRGAGKPPFGGTVAE